MTGRRLWGAALALTALACGGGGGGTGDVEKPRGIQQSARLVGFGSCDALEGYVEQNAILEMRAALERQKPRYWNGTRFGGGRGEGFPTPAPAAGDASGGPSQVTGTNNQVQGVDEADFVKNDGTRIFVLSGKRLYLNRSWPADQLARTGQLDVEGWPQEMLLSGNDVVVFSSVPDTSRQGWWSWGGGGMAVDCFDCRGYYGAGGRTKVTVVDVSDMAAPRVTRELYLPGGYHTARLVDRSVRFVQRDAFRYPQEVRFYVEYREGLYDDHEALEKEIDALKAKNEALIRAQTLDGWLPTGEEKKGGVLTPLPRACEDVHASTAPERLGLVTVGTLDLDAPGEAPGRTSVVSEVSEVYATAERLYVASGHWWWWPEPGQQAWTYLHAFDIRDPQRASYLGSGGVAGTLTDQFNLDEWQGVLRTATTLFKTVEDEGSRWGRTETSAVVSTFRLEGDRLQRLDQTEELAKGERIMSARFIGPRGFVVTFRQVDPLFTFDLSDPEDIQKKGELKVPGFSTYLHPVGDHHLLTIGQHVPYENEPWRDRAVKLSLFDVSDLSNPREAFTQIVGSAYSYSEAVHEHKAFNYFAARGLLAVPFTDWQSGYTGESWWSSFSTQLRVYAVSPDTGFAFKGAVDMKDMYRTQTYTSGGSSWTYTWTPYVRRSVMADQYVYAISDAGIRVADGANLAVPLATTLYERQQ